MTFLEIFTFCKEKIIIKNTQRYFSVKVLLYSALWLIMVAQVDAQQDWKLAKVKDGISVFTRDKAAYNIKEFKANIEVVGVSFDKICNVLRDSDNGEQWIADVVDERILTKDSSQNTTTYLELKLPWPFEGRDMILKNNYIKSDSSLFIDMVSFPGGYAIQNDLIRMKRAEGYWLINKLDNKKVSIEYSFIGDPEGNIPAWVINLFIVDGPLATVSNLISTASNL